MGLSVLELPVLGSSLLINKSDIREGAGKGKNSLISQNNFNELSVNLKTKCSLRPPSPGSHIEHSLTVVALSPELLVLPGPVGRWGLKAAYFLSSSCYILLLIGSFGGTRWRGSR